jgi:hypothetical protein
MAGFGMKWTTYPRFAASGLNHLSWRTKETAHSLRMDLRCFPTNGATFWFKRVYWSNAEGLTPEQRG